MSTENSNALHSFSFTDIRGSTERHHLKSLEIPQKSLDDSPERFCAIPMTLLATSRANIRALERALLEVMKRHDVQKEYAHGDRQLAVEVVNFSHLAASVALDEAKLLAHEQLRKSFDIRRDGTFRATRIGLPNDEHVLAVAIRPAAVDVHSADLLLNELLALYSDYESSGAYASSSATPDHRASEHVPLSDLELQRQQNYWRQNLAGLPALLELQTDNARPPVQSFRTACYHFELGEELGARLRSFSEGHHAGVELSLLTAWSALLSRYSGQDEFCIANIVEGRAASGVEKRIEPLERTLLIRIEVSHNPSFAELLQRIASAKEDAALHGDLPVPYLADFLGANSPSHAPFAQAALAVTRHSTNASTPTPTPTPERQHSPDDNEHPQYDLALKLIHDTRFRVQLHYSSDLFRENTIARLATHLQSLLRGALRDPDVRVFDLPLLNDEEYQQLVLEWNATTLDYRKAAVHELFEQQVDKAPDAKALVFGDQSLTYAQLNAKANQLAHYLRERGVGNEILVGLSVKRSVEMIIGLLGILKAGGAYVPLDPTYPADRLAYMIEDAKPAMLLCQEHLLPQLHPSGVKTFCLDRDWDSISHYEQSNPAARVKPDALAYVIYTSGSTGRPKGAALAHDGLCNLCLGQARAFRVDESSQVLQFASISFDAAVSETFVTLTQGACLHLIKQEALRSSFEILKLLEKSEITVVTLPPSLLAVLPKKPLPALKTLVLAGEAWSPELAKAWADNRLMINAYGPTEATVCATWYEVNGDVGHIVPIGRPLPNVRVYILDRYLEPVPIGVAGELYIGGAGVARGYLRRPDLSAERFVPDPFSASAGGRMYRTGDKVRYLEDGNIEFLGRIDQQVKLRGYRIELGEIEATITTHRAVEDAAVIVREDHPGEKRLVAYVVSNAALDGAGLKRHLKESLPDYMLPQAFVFLDALPTTPNGKVDRKALPLPSGSRSDFEKLPSISSETKA